MTAPAMTFSEHERWLTPDGTAHRIRVIVAGGTLPGERGRGFFERLLRATAARNVPRRTSTTRRPRQSFAAAPSATARRTGSLPKTIQTAVLIEAWQAHATQLFCSQGL